MRDNFGNLSIVVIFRNWCPEIFQNQAIAKVLISQYTQKWPLFVRINAENFNVVFINDLRVVDVVAGMVVDIFAGISTYGSQF